MRALENGVVGAYLINSVCTRDAQENGCKRPGTIFYAFHRPFVQSVFMKKIPLHCNIANALYDFYSLGDTFQKTHSFAALTRSFSNTSQLVNKKSTLVFSMK